MDGNKYREILKENLFQSARDLRLGWRFNFQLDSDPKHATKATLDWFNGKYLNILDWPSQNPDLSPTEKIAVHQHDPSDLKELERFCREGGAQIPEARCAKLIETRTKRLAAGIEAECDSRKYRLC